VPAVCGLMSAKRVTPKGVSEMVKLDKPQPPLKPK
jgi:hypothetical protein